MKLDLVINVLVTLLDCVAPASLAMLKTGKYCFILKYMVLVMSSLVMDFHFGIPGIGCKKVPNIILTKTDVISRFSQA